MSLPLSERVFLLGEDAVEWPFESAVRVRLVMSDSRVSSTIAPVQPTPAYRHDEFLVKDLAEEAESRFAVKNAPDYFILPREFIGNTNGYAQTTYIWNRGGASDEGSYICLSGKVIPIHPAMTRYLVAHEYGHVVHYWIEHQRNNGESRGSSPTSFEIEYAEMRGCECFTGYGAGKWHRNIGEIIVNDFRIIMCRREPEFWPHDGFSHPDSLPHMADYWTKLKSEYEFKPAPVEPELAAV